MKSFSYIFFFVLVLVFVNQASAQYTGGNGRGDAMGETTGQLFCIPTTDTLILSNCGNYVWNGQTYTTSGTYIQTLINAVGCDSIIVLQLTIKQPTADSITQVQCGGNYILNGQTYTISGTYIQTLINAVGCDSVLTLHLSINESTTDTFTLSNCGNYLWNGQTYTTNGTYTQTLTNAANCDSVITIHLTIHQAPHPTITQNGTELSTQTFNTYQWQIDGSDILGANSETYTVIENGNYTVVVTDTNNCEGISPAVNVASVGINEVATFTGKVYPNPASTLFYVEIQEAMAIRIINVFGQTVVTQHLNTGSNSINLSALTPGVYILQSENGSAIKFLKE